jgi:ankyrin repeat protein
MKKLMTLLMIMSIAFGANQLAATELIDAVKAAQYDKIEALIAANVDLNEAENDWTALMYAAKNGDTRSVRLLLDAKEKIDVNYGANTKNYVGTALYLAVWHDHEEVVRMLVDAGADIRAGRSIEKRLITPLRIAAARGNIAIMRLLLSSSSATPEVINYQDCYGNTALMFAASSRKNSAEKVALLLKSGAKVKGLKAGLVFKMTAFFDALFSGNIRSAGKILMHRIKE